MWYFTPYQIISPDLYICVTYQNNLGFFSISFQLHDLHLKIWQGLTKDFPPSSNMMFNLNNHWLLQNAIKVSKISDKNLLKMLHDSVRNKEVFYVILDGLWYFKLAIKQSQDFLLFLFFATPPPSQNLNKQPVTFQMMQTLEIPNSAPYCYML